MIDHSWPELEFPAYVPTAEDWAEYARDMAEQDKAEQGRIAAALADESASHDNQRGGWANGAVIEEAA